MKNQKKRKSCQTTKNTKKKNTKKESGEPMSFEIANIPFYYDTKEILEYLLKDNDTRNDYINSLYDNGIVKPINHYEPTNNTIDVIVKLGQCELEQKVQVMYLDKELDENNNYTDEFTFIVWKDVFMNNMYKNFGGLGFNFEEYLTIDLYMTCKSGQVNKNNPLYKYLHLWTNGSDII